MKRIIVVGLCVLTSTAIRADNEETSIKAPEAVVLKATPNVLAITDAVLGIANELLTVFPGLITDITQFPSLAQADAIALQQEMQIAAKLTGTARQQKIQQLFVDGVNLTILVTNILNKLIVMISTIGPLAEAIDPINGGKVDNVLELTATIMQMISKINIAMKNSIIASGQVTISPQAQVTPAIDPIPDL